MLDTGCWMLDAGCWILDTGCWILDKTRIRPFAHLHICTLAIRTFANLHTLFSYFRGYDSFS